MRIALVLILLLAASARPSSAQYLRPQPALPASLTPAAASASADPLARDSRRDRASGALIGAAAGAVAGALVATLFVCTDPHSDVEVVCKRAGIGLGAIVGLIVGGIIGVPDRSNE